MNTYEIISGRFYMDDGELIGVGYSGKDLHKNDPAAQSVHNAGPIPAGVYRIGAPQNTVTHGPFVLPLSPALDNLMWGREGFLIHGDSVVSPGTASEGCIILSRDVRERIWESGDRVLQVVVSLDKETI